MEKIKTILKLSFVLVVCFIMIGCTKEVPPGWVGIRMQPSGLDNEVLMPGRHTCWGRDRMILVPVNDYISTERLSVLCKDDLNFKFDLKVRVRPRINTGKDLKQILMLQGAYIKYGKSGVGMLPYDVLYKTYVKPAARSIARTVVSKYETTQIRDNREAITKTIRDRLKKALEGTPMELRMVATSNFDYPKVITDAVEKKRKKEIEIQEEKARQAMELLRAENRLKIAQKMKIVRVAEAEAEAAYMKILGDALTDKYLRLKEIEARKLLYEKAAKGDKIIVTGGGNGITPLVNTSGGK